MALRDPAPIPSQAPDASAWADMTDEQLAEQLQAGCSEAFGPLFERLRPRLVHFLWQRTGSPADAEDVAHDAFVRAYEKIDQYNGQYRFTTWLFTIASRIAIDRKRARRAHVTTDALGPLPDDRESPAANASLHEMRDNLWATAARVLSEPQHTALWLRYGEELEIDEIAAVLGRTAVGVRVLLMRARNKLAPHVKRLAPGDVQSQDEPNATGEAERPAGRIGTTVTGGVA